MRLSETAKQGPIDQGHILTKGTHRLAHDVGKAIEDFAFNRAIAKAYEFINLLEREAESADAGTLYDCLQRLILILAPFIPHLAEELWEGIDGQGLACEAPWPPVDPAMLEDETLTLPIQVNGKRRDEITVPKDMAKNEIETLALASEGVQRTLDGATLKRSLSCQDGL